MPALGSASAALRLALACRATTAFASRMARPSSPVLSKRSLATFAHSSCSSIVVALCVWLAGTGGLIAHVGRDGTVSGQAGKCYCASEATATRSPADARAGLRRVLRNPSLKTGSEIQPPSMSDGVGANSLPAPNGSCGPLGLTFLPA